MHILTKNADQKAALQYLCSVDKILVEFQLTDEMTG